MSGTTAFPARLEIPAEVRMIAERLEASGHEAWCVGGSVRDAVLGQPNVDFDIATSARPEEVQRLFRRTVAVGLKYGTIGVLDRERQLHEVTTFRHDVATDGRHAVVAYGASLEEDLARRDLTINAIAYHPIRGEWRDPFGGAADLSAGLVRAVGSAADRFREDYLRILRALRFAARFEFRIGADTWDAARANAGGLAQLSAERVRDEWFKSIRTARSLVRLTELWWESGAAAVRLPELARPADVETHAGLVALEPDARDPVLVTALLCRDAAQVLERLRASNEEIERARAIAELPPEPTADDPVAVRRWLAQAGTAADDLIAVRALRRGGPPDWAATVAAVRERGDPLMRRDLAVSGADLLAAGYEPGPAIGATLDRLLELVLEDPAANRRELLLEHARGLR